MNKRWICHLSGALLISTLQGAENFWDEIPLSPSTTLSPVVFAEATQRFELHHDMGKEDALPNAGGARKIAGTLSNAINTLLGPSSNPTAPSHGND
jgi:hypothetical protein